MWPMPTAFRRGPASARCCALRRGRPRRDCGSRAAERAASLAPTNMPSRAKAAIGASMPSTRRCSRSTSGIARPTGSAAAIRMPWLPSANSSRAQPQVTSMPSAEPKPRSRSSRIAPLSGNLPASCATWRRCASAGPKRFLGEGRAIGRAEQSGADRIGPENPRAVDRPEPGGQGACRMHRQSRIADASQLEFRIIHRNDMIRLARRLPGDGFRYRRPNDDSLNGALVSPAGDGRSTAWRPRFLSKAAITLIRLNPIGACGVGVVANGDQRFTMGTFGRRVIPAKSLVGSLNWANGKREPRMALAIAQQE